MRRIRQLHCRAPMSAAAFALCGSLPGDAGSLFPKLTSLHWVNSWKTGITSSIQMLLSPRLTSLSISVPLPDTILSAIPRTCPALKNLDVYFLDSNEARSAISTCLRNLHSLESVEVTVPNLAALEHLGRLPSLTSLTAKFRDDLSLGPVAPLPFITLKKLVLQHNIESVTDFFQKCSGVPLEGIAIELDLCPTAAAIDRLYTALREGCSHTSLLSLDISIPDDDPVELTDAYAVNTQSLRHLFCFMNVTSVSIASGVGFKMDNQAMKELALAWPRIRELRLKVTPYWTGIQLHPQLSLQCLGTLAEHCQALTDLEITLDATVIPEPDPDLNTRPVSQSALRSFDVAKSPLTSPTLHVARYISALFPSVSIIMTYRTYYDNDLDEFEEEALAYHRLWMEVATHLPTLVAIRQEERLWAHGELGTQ
ncbi:hypothetical protein C8R45DRAFT_1212843 [Mycena sanguinolenta]|nr:hypothetical protein C8R45DRAFT_1212843 [Mycena sanguinolenta]